MRYSTTAGVAVLPVCTLYCSLQMSDVHTLVNHRDGQTGRPARPGPGEARPKTGLGLLSQQA
jgi:hypothetical protein